jgi:predicted small secreted protein
MHPLDMPATPDYQQGTFNMEEAMSLKLMGRFVLILVFGSMLAACGNTWSGMKEDTGDNMEAVGDSVSDAGEDVKEDAK